MRYFLKISYLGKQYSGWQKQYNTTQTVQNLIEEVLKKLYGKEIECIGSSRTDAGVNALCQVAHIDIDDLKIEPQYLLHKINMLLPKDISVNAIIPVEPKFHARFNALSRTYKYCIHHSKNPFLNNTSYYIRAIPDIHLMNKAVQFFFTWNDYKCFSKEHTNVEHFECIIYEVKWELGEGEKTFFHIKANRFLRGMVRCIVGTLLDVGLKKIPLSQFYNIIEKRDRKNASRNVPAHGLCLMDVEYSFPLHY